jgi:hypothetical protein
LLPGRPVDAAAPADLPGGDGLVEAAALGRQQQLKTVAALRCGSRRLLPSVLCRQLRHIERGTPDRQIEQARLRLSRFGIAGSPPRIVSGSKSGSALDASPGMYAVVGLRRDATLISAERPRTP